MNELTSRILPPNRLQQKCMSNLSDVALLAEFCESNNESAFRVLVSRYAPMVSAVCTAVLRNHADAEDAFQATFFVLARKASKINQRENLSAWLHRVALRSAISLWRSLRRHETTELPSDEMVIDGGLEKVSSRAAMLALHEELDRLPEKYRIPLILCYLGAKDRPAASKQLGISEAALDKRLQRGRAMLRRRLGVMGLAVATVFYLNPTVLVGQSVSTSLLNTTVLIAAQVRSAWAKGMMAVTGQHTSLALAQGVLKMMVITHIAKCASTAVIGAFAGVLTMTAVALAQESNGERTDAKPLVIASNEHDDSSRKIETQVARSPMRSSDGEERQQENESTSSLATYQETVPLLSVDRLIELGRYQEAKELMGDPKASDFDRTRYRAVEALLGGQETVPLMSVDRLIELGRYQEAKELMGDPKASDFDRTRYRAVEALLGGTTSAHSKMNRFDETKARIRRKIDLLERQLKLYEELEQIQALLDSAAQQ